MPFPDDRHGNLCNWRVDYDVNDNALEESFYAASLGSPIFASSIIRLASTGEDLRQSVELWRGKDGEEVRQYAFKRELDRLETRDARLLYALCVLGDATKQELEEVTETPGEVVKSSISNLKKFHVLVERKSTRFTDPGYSVSSAVVMLKDIIAEGRFTATECRAIETKCARVVKRASNVTEKVGRAIREIISLQRAGSYDDAVFASQKAVKTFPQNGDLHYFSGLVCLEREPPLLEEAESHFVRAHKLKTKREELPSRWVRARELREDWRGIIDLCDEYGVRRLAFRDCRAVITALDQLIEIAIRRGDLKTAKEHAAMGGKVASEVFIRETTRERRTEMLEVRNRMLRSHVELAKRMVEDNADSHLDVFFAVMQCIENHFVDAETVRLGVKRLESWWQAVERRQRKSEGSLALLRNQLKRFRRLERAITYQVPARTDVLDELQRVNPIVA